jgi:hypothetical protein
VCFHLVVPEVDEKSTSFAKGWMRPDVGIRENGDRAMKSGEGMGRRFGRTVGRHLRVSEGHEPKVDALFEAVTEVTVGKQGRLYWDEVTSVDVNQEGCCFDGPLNLLSVKEMQARNRERGFRTAKERRATLTLDDAMRLRPNRG